jgi:hypothetical protein
MVGMTMKHEPENQTEGSDATPDEPGVPDEKLDPITSGWATALGQSYPGEPSDTDDAAEPDDASAAQVARNEDLGANRPE